MGFPKLLFDNRFSDAVPVASDTAVGNFEAANVADMRSYTWWQPATLPATLTVDCGAAKAADFAAIYGHDLHTQGATIEVRGSTDNFVASDVLVATVAPASDDPFLLEFASVNYRYWRLKITGITIPSIACVLIGSAFVMPKYLGAGFDPLSRTLITPSSSGSSNVNENGQPLGKIIDYEQLLQTLSFGNISWSWLRASWQPAWRSNLRGSPFIFAWDSVNYPTELYLVSTADAYTSAHQQGGLATLSFDVSGVGT